ncbi:hypothetical protein CLROS_002810 [Clostridium felsineum]|uniref:Uncharacterized protein n=1 Tax=Clostridium felsineum TaxID=36839 RepID=A0A1S8LAB0_9CLOT|nr:hypothetical protein [Clostridium felsineum]URZ04957.1 hypothetical protein CLROS_002810 [Clostridium felsineum]URZ09998.1 hypothetical protein CROST_007060 [Clostridium felsineum]
MGYQVNLKDTGNQILIGFIGVNMKILNSEYNVSFVYQHKKISISIFPSLQIIRTSISVNSVDNYEPTRLESYNIGNSFI